MSTPRMDRDALWVRLALVLRRYMAPSPRTPLAMLVHPNTLETLQHPHDRAAPLYLRWGAERIEILPCASTPEEAVWIVPQQWPLM